MPKKENVEVVSGAFVTVIPKDCAAVPVIGAFAFIERK
jgi:hypothetical protein